MQCEQFGIPCLVQLKQLSSARHATCGSCSWKRMTFSPPSSIVAGEVGEVARHGRAMSSIYDWLKYLSCFIMYSCSRTRRPCETAPFLRAINQGQRNSLWKCLNNCGSNLAVIIIFGAASESFYLRCRRCHVEFPPLPVDPKVLGYHICVGDFDTAIDCLSNLLEMPSDTIEELCYRHSPLLMRKSPAR